MNEFRYALQLQDALPNTEKVKRRQVILRAILVRKEAEAYAELGQYSQAWPLFAAADHLFQPLADADKNDAAAAGQIARLLADEAAAREYAADPALAEKHADPGRNLRAEAAVLEELTDVLQQLLKQAPTQQPWISQFASTTIRLSEVRYALRTPVADNAATKSSLAVLRKFTKAPKATADEIDLAATAFLYVQPKTLRDPALAVSLAERGVRLTRGRSPNYLLLLAKAYLAAGNTVQAKVAATQGIVLLGPARPEEQNVRLRRLLALAAR